MGYIYTIGHSTNIVESFVNLLDKYQINCVIDVRGIPFSKYAPQYNKDNIKNLLNKHGIYYIYMGDVLGARRKEPELYSREGYLDFAKVRENTIFLNGINRVINGIKKGYTISLMCTEKEPLMCHRSILLGREFRHNNYEVYHILENGEIESQISLEERLLDLYFKDRTQLSMFDTQEDNFTKLISDAYRLQNKKIGYHLS